MAIPKMAITAALMVANYALTASRKIEGPRLDDLSVSLGDYNTPYPIVFGTQRTSGVGIHAEDLREEKKRRKTKGGKFNDYQYFGTSLWVAAGHESDAVLQVILDKHMVYDASGAGPISAFDFGQAGGVISDYMRIYTGEETQDVDPRYEAWCEARYGADSTPANRGLTTVMFEDLPLEKFGNRLPQPEFVVVRNATPANVYEDFTADVSTTNQQFFSPDYATMYWSAGGVIEVWDMITRTQMAVITLPFSTTTGDGSYGGQAFADGDILLTNDNTDVYRLNADGTGATLEYSDAGADIEKLRVVTLDDGEEHWFGFGNNFSLVADGELVPIADIGGTLWKPTDVAHDGQAMYGLGRANGTSTTELHIWALGGTATGGYRTITMPVGNGSNTFNCYGIIFDGDLFVYWGSSIYRIDLATDTIIDSLAFTPLGRGWGHACANWNPSWETIWVSEPIASVTEIDLATLTELRTIDPHDNIAETGLYNPMLHAVTTKGAAGAFVITYLDRFTGSGVTLGSIFAEVSDAVGVENYNFDDLDQVVDGWLTTRGTASNMLEPLLDVYDSDIGPKGFTITGQKRHGVAAGSTITTEYLVGKPRYVDDIRPEIDLPRLVDLAFADLNNDWQPNNASSPRRRDATAARGEQSLAMDTLALDAADARAYNDRYFRRLWNNRQDLSTGLTRMELAIEPNDVRNIETDGVTDSFQLRRMTVQSDGVIETEWRFDAPTLALTDNVGAAEMEARTPDTIVLPGPTRGFILDVPLLSDVDDGTNPVLYVGGGPYSSGSFPGVVHYEYLNDEFGDELASIPSSSPATWGIATDVLADGPTTLADEGNSVNIRLLNGSLSGTTLAAIQADRDLNFAYLGGELIQFAGATLEADGTYTLTNLRRGRRGTEFATAGHATGDIFVLIEDLETAVVPLGEVGSNQNYISVSLGRSTGLQTALTPFSGASLKPRPPVIETARKLSNGDWLIEWRNRTRIGGTWNGGNIPLGEASENYSLDIGDGVDSEVLTTSSKTITWTLAEQTALTGGEVTAGNLEFTVYQVSAAVGRGFGTSGTA